MLTLFYVVTVLITSSHCDPFGHSVPAASDDSAAEGQVINRPVTEL